MRDETFDFLRRATVDEYSAVWNAKRGGVWSSSTFPEGDHYYPDGYIMTTWADPTNSYPACRSERRGNERLYWVNPDLMPRGV